MKLSKFYIHVKIYFLTPFQMNIAMLVISGSCPTTILIHCCYVLNICCVEASLSVPSSPTGSANPPKIIFLTPMKHTPCPIFCLIVLLLLQLSEELYSLIAILLYANQINRISLHICIHHKAVLQGKRQQKSSYYWILCATVHPDYTACFTIDENSVGTLLFFRSSCLF